MRYPYFLRPRPAAELDVVRTKVDLLGYGPLGIPVTVPAGSQGTVVLISMEVEFVDGHGETWAMLSCDPDQLYVKWRCLK